MIARYHIPHPALQPYVETMVVLEGESPTEELLDYYVVSEVKYKGPAATQHGDKPFLQVTWFQVNGANFFTKSSILTVTYTSITDIDYDAAKGVTTLKGTDNPHFNFTRDRQDNIILSAKGAFENANVEILHSELIKASALIYHSNTLYKGVENNPGYFKFNNNRWHYATTNSFPAVNWHFIADRNFLWSGYDAGTSRWFNFFVAIPKGYGWKGQRKDKDLLLVSYSNNGAPLDGVVICERQ